jgi:hypothetical protein
MQFVFELPAAAHSLKLIACLLVFMYNFAHLFNSRDLMQCQSLR